MRATTRLVILGAAILGAVSLAPTSHRHPAAVPAPPEVAAALVVPIADGPEADTLTAAAVAPPVVVVRDTDTLSAIGTRLGVTWQQLAGWNHLTWSQAQQLTVGQVLNVPPSGYSPPALTPPAPPARPVVLTAAAGPGTPRPTAPVGSFAAGSGIYSYAALESLWVDAGGPSWAASRAAEIAECESGGKPWAYNRSGATGLWQILGSVVPGNLYDPMVNAENAVSKFHGSHDTFAQWVCQ